MDSQAVTLPHGRVHEADGREPIDQRLFRTVMGLFATGITVVTVEVRGETFGMTANAFMAGSLEPPLCVISVRNVARLCGRLREAGRYGVSLLTQEQQFLSNHFAGRRLPGTQPEFERLDGTPVLKRSLAMIAADICNVAACGDHTLVIGHVTAMRAGGGKPLLYYKGRYARVDMDHPIEQIDPPTFW